MSAADRIETNLRKGILEYCVLALLSHGDRYGLELAESLVRRELIASEGSLYPLLARMLASGLVSTRWENAEGVRPRKYYAITEAGREQLLLFAGVWQRVVMNVDDLMKESS